MENKIREATLGIADELRNMEIGETVNFPLPKYNYNSIRTAPSTTLFSERMQGMRWKRRVDYDNKCVMVTRIA